MAKLKVSELTRTANVNGTDLVYIVQGINSRATTVANLFVAANVNLVGPPGSPGEQGPQGPEGAPGLNGTNGDPLKNYIVTSNNQANAFFFTGTGFEDLTSTPNPPLYLYRGFEYRFENILAENNPLFIKYSANGNIFESLGYFENTSDVLGFANVQTISFVVPFSAPSTLYYQSNSNPEMGNVIYIN